MYIHIHIPGKHSLFDVLEPNLLLVQSSFSQVQKSQLFLGHLRQISPLHVMDGSEAMCGLRVIATDVNMNIIKPLPSGKLT
jgi:hypothetical protein